MIVRGQFTDQYLETALLAIDDVIFESQKEWPEMAPRVFNVKTSKRSIEQTSEVTGLGQMIVTPEGGDVRFDDPLQGFDKTYLHVKYGLGFKYSRESLEDGKFGTIREMSRELAKSGTDTRESVGADIFNQGFNSAFPGPDGQPLFSTAHPLVKAGGTEQNTLSVPADIEVPALELALTDFRNFVSHSGKPKLIEPRRLLIPTDLEFASIEILRSPMRSDTANNATNAFLHRVGLPAFEEIVIWWFLTDPDAWFILANPADTGLRWYNRRRFYVKAAEDYESESAKVAARMRFSVGFSHFWGVYGSPGA